MSSLSDKLKSLGVQLGPQGLRPPELSRKIPVEKIIEGRYIDTPFGQTFVVETHYSPDHYQGSFSLNIETSLNIIAAWAGESRLKQCRPQDFLFLDTETTGLSGGTGTYAFLIGAGRIRDNGFQLTQYFMRDPIEEPAQLTAFASSFGTCDSLVTFNGKAFDVPLLNSRFSSIGETSPLRETAHLDLLPLARRLWRDRLSSRSLNSLEEHILGVSRSQDDVPGWLIPNLYFQYLRDGDARPLKNIFYHNAMDIASMAALLNSLANRIENPLNARFDHEMDIVGIAKLYEDLGKHDQAVILYARSLDCQLPHRSRCEAIKRWSFIEKRRGNFDKALELWLLASSSAEIYACVELAKYYEHHQGDFNQALFWTDSALASIAPDTFPPVERCRWENELRHRQARLLRRLESKSDS